MCITDGAPKPPTQDLLLLQAPFDHLRPLRDVGEPSEGVMQVGDPPKVPTQDCCFTNPLRPPTAATSPATATPGEDLALVSPR